MESRSTLDLLLYTRMSSECSLTWSIRAENRGVRITFLYCENTYIYRLGTYLHNTMFNVTPAGPVSRGRYGNNSKI